LNSHLLPENEPDPLFEMNEEEFVDEEAPEDDQASEEGKRGEGDLDDINIL
jgi:hypothetical protein